VSGEAARKYEGKKRTAAAEVRTKPRFGTAGRGSLWTRRARLSEKVRLQRENGRRIHISTELGEEALDPQWLYATKTPEKVTGKSMSSAWTTTRPRTGKCKKEDLQNRKGERLRREIGQ